MLAPTREIAQQIHSVMREIGSAMPGLKCHTFIGGMPILQDKILCKRCHIAVGTPGNLCKGSLYRNFIIFFFSCSYSLIANSLEFSEGTLW